MSLLDQVAGSSPQDLALLYADMESRGEMSPSSVARALIQAGLPHGASLLEICSGVEAWQGHAYHGSAHHAEVMLNAWRLGARDPATMLAAAGHDWGYRPGIKAAGAEQEQVSADKVGAVLIQNGCRQDLVHDVHQLILATFPPLRDNLRKGHVPVAQLGAHLRVSAQILSDADLLSSAGLSSERSHFMSQRLARETGKSATPEGFAKFLDAVVGPDFISPDSTVFTAALQQIRTGVLESVQAPSSRSRDQGR